MGLFKPAWKGDSKNKALRAVAKERNQRKLHKIAKNAPERDVRKAAAEKLTGQAALADVAKNDPESDVREAAAEKLTDQAALADLVKSESSSYVRAEIVKKLTDQEALAYVAKNDFDHQMSTFRARLTAAGKLADQTLAQETYADIAKSDADCDYRLEAAKRLTDQTLAQETYADIAKSDTLHSARLEAAKRLTDQTLAQEAYADIAKNHKGDYARKDAIAELTDQAVLAYVAQHDPDYGLRVEAAKKLTNQDLAQEIYAYVAKNVSVDNSAGYEAAKALTDHVLAQKTFASVIIDGYSPYTRLAAVERLTDLDLLADVVRRVVNDELRSAVNKRWRELKGPDASADGAPRGAKKSPPVAKRNVAPLQTSSPEEAIRYLFDTALPSLESISLSSVKAQYEGYETSWRSNGLFRAGRDELRGHVYLSITKTCRQPGFHFYNIAMYDDNSRLVAMAFADGDGASVCIWRADGQYYFCGNYFFE